MLGIINKQSVVFYQKQKMNYWLNVIFIPTKKRATN